jgi:hypothetical protein
MDNFFSSPELFNEQTTKNKLLWDSQTKHRRLGMKKGDIWVRARGDMSTNKMYAC